MLEQQARYAKEEAMRGQHLYLNYRVSNGTGQCNFSGQRDNGTSTKPRAETGQDSLSNTETGRGTG